MTYFPQQQSYFRAYGAADYRKILSSDEEDPLQVSELPTLSLWLQLSNVIVYCRSLFTTIISVPRAALLFTQRSYQYIRKRYYLATHALNIPFEDEKIRAAFRRIQALREYPLILPIIQAKELLNRGSEDEKAFTYFREYILQGTSLGEPVALLHSIKPNQSCQTLLASVSTEDVFYYQMLHKMEQAFNRYKIHHTIGQRLGRSMLVGEPGDDPRLIESRQKLVHQHRLLTEQLEAAHTRLKAELYPKLSAIFATTQPATDYQAVLEKTPHSENFAGRVLILEKDESIPGKNKLIAVRSVFIQCIQGQYRFYRQKEDFYVYSTKESFFLALREQMMNLGSSQIQFSLS